MSNMKLHSRRVGFPGHGLLFLVRLDLTQRVGVAGYLAGQGSDFKWLTHSEVASSPIKGRVKKRRSVSTLSKLRS